MSMEDFSSWGKDAPFFCEVKKLREDQEYRNRDRVAQEVNKLYFDLKCLSDMDEDDVIFQARMSDPILNDYVHRSLDRNIGFVRGYVNKLHELQNALEDPLLTWKVEEAKK